jgi:multicomponent Na+:H+ antiporter subunit E
LDPIPPGKGKPGLLKEKEKAKNRGLNILATFTLLFAFWLILSGFFDLFHIFLGVICCGIISYASHDLIFTQTNLKTLRERHRAGKNFFLYLPWLMYQIYLANLHLIYLVWHPGMPIHPEIIRFKTKWKGDLVLVTMANSITLTPGTITLDVRQGEFYVHALSKKVADDLLGGEMQDRVGRVFGEDDWRVDE